MAKPEKRSKTWRIRWTDAAGRRHSETHFTYKDAAFALQRHELEAQEIKRGLRAPSRPQKTFDQLADHWIRYRASQKRSARDDESIIRRHRRPAFGTLQLSQVTV
ncbi:MAG: hypothetical protein ACI9WU_000859 [Myxococcota bacterium]|jgi:hypothetical protein